ncbi:uncharacterized protein LOC142339752 isoform X2 [Convolutriloba macropyga]|uniref:uncharacterized protein LOC142339752 isoform X2 n=1 Tax=Convolutriloba macropyga TaxID=536237 RepID=UPI003F5247BB
MDEEKLSKDEQTKDDDKVKDDEHEDDTAENEGNTVKKEEKKKHHKKKNKKKGKHHKTRSANSSSENLSIDVGSSRSHSSTADDDGSGSGTPSKTKSKKSKKNKSHKNHKSKHKTPKSEETSGSGASPTQSEDSKLSSYPEADQDIPTDKRPSTGTKPKQEEEKAEEPNANSTASTKKKSSGPDVTGSSSAQKPSTISGSVDVVESVTSDALGKSGTSKTSGTGSVKAFGSTQKKSSGSDVAGSSSAQKTSTVSGSVDVVESVTSAALGESGPSKVSGSTKKKLSGPEAAGSSVAQKNSSTVSGSVDVVDSVTSAALDKSASGKISASTTKKSSGQEAAGSSVAQKTSTVSGSVDVVQSVASAALGKSGPSKISESKTSKTPRKASSTRDDFLSGKSVDRAIKQDNGKQLKDSAEAKMSQAPRKASSTRDDFLSRESTGQTIDSGGQDTRQHSTTYGSFHTKAEAKGSKTPRKASSTRDDFLSRESTKQSIKVDGVNQSIDSGGQKDRLNSTTYGSFHTKAGADQVVLSKKQSSTSGEKGSVESKHEVLDKLSEISQKRSTDQKKLSETAEGIPSITKADSITEENVPLSLSGEKTSKAGQEVEDVPTIPESGSMLLREKSSTLPGIKTSPAYEAKKSQSTNNESLAVESLRGSAANKMSLQHYEEPQDGDFIIPSLEAKEEEYMRYPAVGKTPSEQLGNFEEGDEEQDEEEQLEELNDNVDDEQTEPQQQFLEGDEDLDEEERMEELEDNKGKDEYVEPQQQFLGEEEEYAENGLGDNKVEDEYVEPQSQVVTGDVLNEERADSESDKDKRDSKRPTKSSGVWEIFRARLSHLRDNIRSSRTLDMFDTDSVIMLVNKVCKGAMRVTDLDEIDCKGNQYYRHDEQLHFRVINYGWNIISLKSLTFPLVDDKFLCVRRDGRLYSDGAMRSNETRFRMHETKDNCVTFESYVEIMHHIAFTKKGTLIPPNKMPKKEECTHFYFIVIRSGEELDTQPQALRYSNF